MSETILDLIKEASRPYNGREYKESPLAKRVINTVSIALVISISFIKYLTDRSKINLPPEQYRLYSQMINTCEDYGIELPEKFSKLEGIAIYTPVEAEISIDGEKSYLESGCYIIKKGDISLFIERENVGIYNTHLCSGQVFSLDDAMIAVPKGY